MKRAVLLVLSGFGIMAWSLRPSTAYYDHYLQSVKALETEQTGLKQFIEATDLSSSNARESILEKIGKARMKLKLVDFWLRYLDPVEYNKINGQLPVEWETEVFEKFEKPYRRDGAGLSLAAKLFDVEQVNKDSLLSLVNRSISATHSFFADSNTSHLTEPGHFFFANRLFLLNLAAIYTTGFECPDKHAIVPELKFMLNGVQDIYRDYNNSFPSLPFPAGYQELFVKCIRFVNSQPDNYEQFDHYTFIRDYVNPLFAINQKLIQQYRIYSKSFVDFSLNDTCSSIFRKSLFIAQHPNGIFSLVEDEAKLKEIRRIGKLLFFDPILSGNNKRSCASCHNQEMYFTDTTVQTALQFDSRSHLSRGTPSLVNVIYNHLIMQDGKHLTLLEQGKTVIQNPIEMHSMGKEVLNKILSCPEYKNAFRDFVKLTPEENKITIDHVVSAISSYYGSFSNYYSPFDDAMNQGSAVDEKIQKGFNLFMSKGRCATCHFMPQFNGIKPPYVNSEFEVLGVPADTFYRSLSPDSGRYLINPAPEMMNAFRTPSLRNARYTAPYMHHGKFPSLQSVMEFYDAGGGVGHGLRVSNQTLETDSLHLSANEKTEVLGFLFSLSENIPVESAPVALPKSRNKALNGRKVGGEY